MNTETEKERIVNNLIEREVLVCQSCLVGDLLSSEDVQPAGTVGFYLDDIINLYINTDEEAKDLGYDSLEAMQDSGEDMKEVFEWWAVTEYLARRIEKLGGIVIKSGYGTWWGREETGQPLTMDAMLNSVAETMMEVK